MLSISIFAEYELSFLAGFMNSGIETYLMSFYRLQ